MKDWLEYKWQRIKDFYYDVKWGIWAIGKYWKIVLRMRPWDKAYVYEMMVHQLKILRDCIDIGYEVYEDRQKRIRDMNRTIELLNHFIEENFIDRVGGLTGSDFDFKKLPNGNYELVDNRTEEEQAIDKERMEKAWQLEEDEWEELWNIIKSGKESEAGIQGWWS